MSTPSSALGFLTGTTTPVSSQTQNQNQVSTQLPDWYTNYTQTILNNAAAFAAQPYQTYQGPRIAAQSPLTNSAYTGASGLIPQAGAAATTANNLLARATSQASPLSAANPYLSAAASPTTDVSAYMNPYTNAVAGNIATLGAQNFNENILPSITNSFASAGNITGGNTQEANLVQQAARNEMAGVSQAQAGALSAGYGNAQQAALADAARMAGLGSVAGGLQATGNQLGLAGATNAALIGGQNVNNLTGALQATNALGQQQQAYGQSNLNLAYQDFLNQKYYPMQQVGALQSALNGIQVPTATNTSQLQTNYGQAVSPMQQIIGALQGFNSATGPGGALTSSP